MELSFQEIERADPPQFESNYWNSQPDHSAQKKAHFSYDDIYKNLNLVVHNGVLKKIQVKPIQENVQNKHQPQAQKTVTVEPPVKNSYIYNKYFKDYTQPGAPVEPVIPLTPEQRKQKAMKDYLARVAEQKRIEQFKSKKLLFNTNNIQVSPNTGNLNKLFHFNR